LNVAPAIAVSTARNHEKKWKEKWSLFEDVNRSAIGSLIYNFSMGNRGSSMDNNGPGMLMTLCDCTSDIEMGW
jgi:hypothetical protein